MDQNVPFRPEYASFVIIFYYLFEFCLMNVFYS